MSRLSFPRNYSRPTAPSEDAAPRDAETWLRSVLPEAYFVNAPRHDMPRHRTLLENLREGDVLMEFHRHRLGRLTELTLCAFDDDEPGLLARVSGALASLGIDLRTAYVYTFDAARLPQHSQDTRRVAFDILFLCRRMGRHDRALDDDMTQQAHETLLRVLAGRETTGEQWRKTLRRAPAPLNIEELVVTPNATSEGLTRIALRASDSACLLFHATAALAALGLDIRTAQINTGEGTVDDVFYVAHHGSNLSTATPDALAKQLHEALEQRVA